ncbi:MAG: response regulator transcription factor [Bacteroidetes bacterium]|nr:response regulator transcription factor [Bacteroidota bacterium]
MAKIKILIADNSFLIREGFRSVINENSNFKLVGEAQKAEDLSEKLLLHLPHVLVIDYTSLYFCIDDILVIHQHFPEVNILAVTNPQSKTIISKAIENGVVSHLLKDCGKDEIIEAINNTAKGQKFFCGKIIDTILTDKDASASLPVNTGQTSMTKTAERVSCDGIKPSVREIEIIQLVADGLTNKQIADKLFLSVHTVTTHRKNIMSKLGVNNTAGLVMFAIRQNLIESNKFLFAN